jgi:NAD(P)-dependent dehydrogenase (short-subunit alcohol dehydrogenase family)
MSDASTIFPGRFAGQRAIVTGGASGIGLAVATRLAAEGAAVTIWDANRESIAASRKTAGPKVVGAVVDVTDFDAVDAAAIAAQQRMGGIDILVCSAGITGPNTPLADYPVDAWQKVIQVNVNGVFHCNRAVVPHMLSGGYGRIVNIASVAGKEGNPNASAYSTSKAAVIGMTKSLGKELAQKNVTVNAVTPAAVKTAIFAQMTQQHIDFMLSKIPIGRFGEVAEVTALVCWLASRECSFSTGSVFDVSGGRATY